MATTIRQLAEAAGVSVATASRALADSPAVVQATKDRVLQVAQELNYTPSRLGRSLATGSTGNIGVILPDLANPFYIDFLGGLETALAPHDRGILVGDSHESPELELSTIQRMTGQVDTLVLASSRLTDADIVAAARCRPTILANRSLARETIAPDSLCQLVLDTDAGFTAAVALLRTSGHRSVLYIDGPPQSWSGQQKRRVIERQCALGGLLLRIVSSRGADFGGGRAALAELFDREGSTLGGITAVIAFNDQVALGVLSVLRENSIAVPGLISVIGCDDALPTGLAWPALTTVDSSARLLGALAAAAILDPDSNRSGSVPSRLIERDSTAARASAF